MFVALGNRHATRMRHIVVCGLPPLYKVFPYYLINGTIFRGGGAVKIKCVFLLPLKIWSETFLILRRTERGMIKNVYWVSRKVSVILVRFWWKLNKQISHFGQIRPVGTKLLHADGRTDRQTDRHDDYNTFRKLANASENQSVNFV